jgi:hypothetical protein
MTFDITFAEEERYRRVLKSKVLNPALFAKIYRVAEEDVAIYGFDATLTIKATIPRANAAGGIDETDFDGAQQFIPLLDVEIP